MNFNQLLDTSTPFDANKLALLEQVVNVLYSASTNQNDVSIISIIIIYILIIYIETNFKYSIRQFSKIRCIFHIL